MQSDAQTVEEYLNTLPEDRREAVSTVRSVILENLPAGFEEGMQFGMIGYYVPLSRYPKTYNGKPLSFASLASQKNYMSLYLMCVYGNPEEEAWFKEEWAQSGKKLNMGKSCVRFRAVDDVPLEIVGKAIARTSVDEFIELYEQSRR